MVTRGVSTIPFLGFLLARGSRSLPRSFEVFLALKVIFCCYNILPTHYRIRVSEECLFFLSFRVLMAFQFSLQPASCSQESFWPAAQGQTAPKRAGAGVRVSWLCRMSLAVWSFLSQALALGGLWDFPEMWLLSLWPELLGLLTAFRDMSCSPLCTQQSFA